MHTQQLLAAPDSVRNNAAVLFGATASCGLSNAIVFAVTSGYFWLNNTPGVPATASDVSTLAFTLTLIGAHLLSLIGPLAGGGWLAKLSASGLTRNTLLASLFAAGLCVWLQRLPHDLPVPLWSSIATLVLPLFALPLGVWLYKRDH
ncbi:hypothetical protein H8K47_09085 [Undibacterium sp. CY7W]|uniref:Uncharacterized protein n=1 Tax=Undibacterium rugosum TaxID=2762291 RepID=A0A923I3S4_9BURK|nr:hypothetical protein [Undibacterium rugosum]MBC3935514.1 hypothetical protein [Undibacterium rugosum]